MKPTPQLSIEATPLKLPFTHAGKQRHLVKHPRVQAAVKAGTLTIEQALEEPWYLRVKFPSQSKERNFMLSVSAKQAVADAFDKLNGHQQQPERFAEWLAERDARRGLTVGALAKFWLTDGCPFSQVKPRSQKEAHPLKECLKYALPWWDALTWASIKPRTLEEYVLWRRQEVRKRNRHVRYTGDRSADLELAALSCLGQWAMLSGRVDRNPFLKRPRFQNPEHVRHCHQIMPDNDEQFHAVLHWLFTKKTDFVPGMRFTPEEIDRNRKIAGGWLAICALTGLRPGEPEQLLHLPPLKEFPTNLERILLGQIYPMPDGTKRMKVARLKHGQNPAIVIHSALQDFLDCWIRWLDHTQSTSEAEKGRGTTLHPRLFPMSGELVPDHLTRACKALNITPRFTPHSFGRAYYVRVRRSQGIDDSTIAVELGQTSDGDLIRHVYGDPVDPVGGNLHDWTHKPNDQGQPVPAAWRALLEQVDATIVPVKFG